MKRYCVRCREGKVEFLDIIAESNDEYRVRITKISDGNEKIIQETMTKDLFDMCVKTGYIFEMEDVIATVA